MSTDSRNNGQPAGPVSGNGQAAEGPLQRLARIAEELTRDIPREVWDELPRDLSINLEHYLYGHPKSE